LFDASDAVMSRHGDDIRRWGVGRVTVSPAGRNADPTAFAYTEGKPGGSIVLTREMWEDQPKMVAALKAARLDGHLTQRVESTPQSVLVHEYGHVLANSALADPETARLLFQKFGQNWKQRASTVFGSTAAVSFGELIAEAFVEQMLAPTPSRLGGEVYDLVSGRLAGRRAERKVVAW
jgi:hypothetical protein